MNANREELLFALALTKPAAERTAWLDRECGDDKVFRARLDALLAAHEKSEGVLAEVAPAAVATMKLKMPDTPDEAVGQQIGRYKILERVGEGGCGVVYVAEQSAPVRRRVALKVIKLGMDTKQVVARFEAERQALAMMDHPNIAKVLDAGSTESGRPYFVMELVRGIKLTDYCDQHKLGTEERLGLFIQICHAIQHAHQKGIIHRDIKPSNILVTLHDGVPVPMVIDFGIAKATEGRLTDATVYTQLHQFIGTPAYMSPEQAEMSGLDIDTRSDIYSLGVLLYELLAGSTPFDAKELMASGIDVMRKIIREQEPMRPSTRLATLQGAELTTTAVRRSVETSRLAKLLRGDLDWIVMKCLEKDRTRRYETANGLAMELRRYLNHEPVVARPPSGLYRLRKAVRRNKLAFAAGSAVTLVLITGAVASSLQAVRARRAELVASQQRDAARKAQQRAEALNRFLREDVLLQATPDKNAPEAMREMMGEILSRAAQKLDRDSELVREPELEATLRIAVGETYLQLGEWQKAERHFRRAVSLRRTALGADNLETLLAQKYLACLLILNLGQWDGEGEKLSYETWQGLSRALNEGQGGSDKKSLTRAVLDAQSAYIWSLANRGNPAKAAALKRENAAAYEQMLGVDDHDAITAMQDLAVALELSGDFASAEQAYREAARRFERTGQGDTYDGQLCAYNSAWCGYFLQGDSRRAEEALSVALVKAKKLFPEEHPLTLDIQHRLVRCLSDERRWAEAETLAEATLASRSRVLPPKNGRTAYSMVVLARILIETGRLDRAEELLSEARTIFRERYAEQPRLAAAAENWLGVIALARKDYPRAESLLLPLSEQFLKPTIQMSPRERRDCLGHLVKLYQDWGKPEQAALWRQKVKEIEGEWERPTTTDSEIRTSAGTN